ncbi:MAG: aminotransferase class I/II-fold pyridoxal phosphate-dependent enzyme [Bacteroidota bacterium]
MNIKPASRIAQIKEYYFSTKLKEIARLRESGKDIINLGIGSPDLMPSYHAIDVLVNESKSSDNHKYQSYIGIPELRQAFANWYQRFFEVELDPKGEILPLIGSKEGIMHISMTYLEAGDQVLIPNPGYPAYRSAALLAGAEVLEYKLDADRDWMPDLDALEQQDLSRVKIMWVNYPHMPTGTKASRSFFERLIAFARKHHILLCNDNPYSFILNDEPMSLLSVEGAMEVALELNSLSKSHNMAGWRIGMLAGDRERLATILRFKSNMDSGMFRPMQLAAVSALNNPASWYKSLNEIYQRRRQKAFELLDLLGCRYQKDQCGLFVWAAVPSAYENGYQLSDEILYQHDVFLTPGGIFGSQGDAYVRVSLCNKQSTFEEVLQRLRSESTQNKVAAGQ